MCDVLIYKSTSTFDLAFYSQLCELFSLEDILFSLCLHTLEVDARHSWASCQNIFVFLSHLSLYAELVETCPVSFNKHL